MTSLDIPAKVGAVRFLGQRRRYTRLLVRGAILLMLSLGIYRFWLATDVRRFLWSSTEIEGETLEYTGTALELLVGFLIAIGILIPVYGAIFLAALDLGPLGRWSGVIGFVLLALLGQYAIFRARRYRLTRTVFRGIRFHQDGSAWRYAFCALFWWLLSALTLGLGYPWQVASLERYKMRNTYYGDLAGRFDGSALRLFVRGLPMWFLVMAPLIVTVGALLETVNWDLLADAAAEGGDDVMGRMEGASPGFAGAIVFAMLMAGCSVAAVAIFYPAFQAMLLRWWCSGLRFGDIEVRSRLRTLAIYGAYGRFLGYALLFSLTLGVAAVPALMIVGYVSGAASGSIGTEVLTTAMLLIGYVIAALGYSTVYQVTVKYSFWQLGVESLQLSGTDALEHVKATGLPSSAVGEGLADALNVGGY